MGGKESTTEYLYMHVKTLPLPFARSHGVSESEQNQFWLLIWVFFCEAKREEIEQLEQERRKSK
jgi:hypothetical protein